jgi:O-antigen ligase
VLSLVRWALLPFGWEGWAAPVGGGRAVDAAGALVMAQAAVLGLVAWARGEAPRWMRRLTPALLGAVVLMRHRTVWAVLLGTVAVVIVADRRTARRLLPLTAAGLVVVLAVSLTVLDQDAGELQEDLAGAATYRDTWEWRVDGWVALIEQSGPRDHPEVLIGRPFGGGWARVMDRGTVEVSPHSFYLETFLRVGVIGVALLTLLYAIIIWRLAGARRQEGGLVSHASLFLVLVGHPIYFVAYTPHPEQGVLFGLALAAAASLTARGTASPGISVRRGDHLSLRVSH